MNFTDMQILVETLRARVAEQNEYIKVAQPLLEELTALKAGQGEPLIYASSEQDEQGRLEPLFTQGCATSCLQAPAIPAGYQLVKTEDIQFCLDSITDWGAYAGAYFAEKWNLAGDIERAKAMFDAKP